MALRTLQITMNGSLQNVGTAALAAFPGVSTKARWLTFQNNAAAAVRVGDANTTSSKGISLPASNVANSVYSPPVPTASPTSGFDLTQWNIIGTNTQLLDVTYDDMNF